MGDTSFNHSYGEQSGVARPVNDNARRSTPDTGRQRVMMRDVLMGDVMTDCEFRDDSLQLSANDEREKSR